MTTAIRALPLSVASSRVSSVSPCGSLTSDPIERCSTVLSPSAGRTCSMYLMNVSFGPTTSTPSRPSCGFAYSSQAARCRPTAVLPVPGPPWMTSAPCALARDQLVLVGRDGRDDLAHLADALAGDVLDDRVGEVVLEPRVERLVDEAEHLAVLDVEPAAPPQTLRVALGGGVERLGGGGAPVDREQVVGRAVDGVAADVQRLAVGAVDAAEVQRSARFGVHADALPPHGLEGLVGVVVVPAVAAPAGQCSERDVVRGARRRPGVAAPPRAPP